MTSIAETARSSGWDEPGAELVADGVHRIPLPMPRDALRAINVYAVSDGVGLVLIDSGPPHPKARQALDAGLESIGAGVADISRVITTHAHYDHYGLTSAIRGQTGAEVVLGVREAALLSVALSRDSYDRWLAHRREWLGRHDAGAILSEVERIEQVEQFAQLHGSGVWEPPDTEIDDGDVLTLNDRRLQAIWTPGHTRGHLVFLDAEHGLLFAGDHILPHITPSLGFEPFADGRALEFFLGSLARVRDLPAARVLPGHGPAFDDLAGRVDELTAHHQRRLAKCVDAISEAGAATAHTVASKLTWTSRDRAFSELDPFNRMLAVTETVTHLEWLVANHRLTRTDGGDRIRYAAA